MKKITMLIAILFLLAISLVFAASISKQEREQINECRMDCNDERRGTQKTCQEGGKLCLESCNLEHNQCMNVSLEQFDSCKIQCEETFQINQSMSASQKKEFQQNQYVCNKQCQREFGKTKRNECNIGECKRECTNERGECITSANTYHRLCSQSCQYLFLNSGITCENGTYSAGQTILRDCDTCKCGFDGKLKCTQHASCHFFGMNETSQEECESADGFYQELCQGNIYAMRCTEEFYCQCSGIHGYTCPENQICLKEFRTHGILKGNLKTWSERGGRPLGDVGICAPLPQLESCGNDICEDILVDFAAETSMNCPVDCGND